MNYSYTKAKKKHILKPATRIWIFYLIIALGLILGFKLVLTTQINLLKDKELELNTKQDAYNINISKLGKELDRLNKEVEIINLLSKDDKKLKEQIINIINLIPEQITISKISINKDRLEIQGITPTKEVFTNSLQAQLSSIFDISRADFYKASNGWYSFISVSRLITSDDIEKRSSLLRGVK